jgi:hypothetical protein
MTDNDLDGQLAAALSMPDDELMPAADLLTVVRARQTKRRERTTIFAATHETTRANDSRHDRFHAAAPASDAPHTTRPVAPGPPRPGRLLPSLAVGLAVGVLIAAVLGGSMLLLHRSAPVAPSGVVRHPKATPLPTAPGPTVTPRVAYTVPAGEQPPFLLAADPKRRGVWFITATGAGTAIVFVSVIPSQSRVYPLHVHYPLGASGGMAVAGDGTVWAGVNMMLIHLNPTSGAVTTYRVPMPADKDPAEANNPPSMDPHFINSVAVTGADTVALAVWDADQVVVLHQGRFADWPLPANTVPDDVAYLNDGTLGVALGDYNTTYEDRVVTFTPTGTRSESPPIDVTSLVSTGRDFVSATTQIVVFDARAQIMATVPFVPAIKPYRPAAGALGILPNGDLVVEGWDGVLVASLSSGATRNMQFPRGACPDLRGISIPPGTRVPTPYPAGYLCDQAPQLMATDGAGDVWLTLANQSEIDVLEGVGSK